MKHIPHLYIPGPWESPGLGIDDSQSHHLGKVLRVAPHSQLSYTDGEGAIGLGVWTGTELERGEEERVPRPSNLTMAVAPPANKDRVRFVVEKLGELGIASLVWLQTANGSNRVPSFEKQKAWAIAALEQSRGGWLLGIRPELGDWSSLATPLVVCQSGGSGASSKPASVAVGPEGGFDKSEVPEHAEIIGLGPTVLRVETAAVVAATRFR